MLAHTLGLVTLLLATSSAFQLANHRTSRNGALSRQQSHHDRRDFIVGGVAAFTSSLLLQNQPAHAMPMVTTDEFRSIARDSAQAISRVEFSGRKKDSLSVCFVQGNLSVRTLISFLSLRQHSQIRGCHGQTRRWYVVWNQ